MQRRKVSRINRSLNYTLPCPIGGLNMRDSLGQMNETDAIVMDNYFPGETKISLRKGYVRYVTTGKPVHTLVEHRAESGLNSFFAFCDNELWDITSKSAPIKIADDFTNDKWQTVQFKNRLFAVNGADTPQTYLIEDSGEGVWKNAEFSGDGLIPASLVNVTSSKQRLWFVEKNSLKAWYSENAAEVQGKLLCFDMSTIARDGGSLVAIASWTQDGGMGIDDLTVFITSEGEALIYSGSNPNSAQDWELRGVYRVGRPIGYRCILQYQGDVVLVSVDGYLPLSKALPLNSANNSQISFSDKIRGLVLERTALSQDKFGWQPFIYNRGGYALFNVPVNQSFEQHVVNLNTGAWCRFTNVPALCWGLYQNRAYFGMRDGVMLFDESYADELNPIEGHIEQAFSSLGISAMKKLQLLNPRTKAFNPFALTLYANADFADDSQPFMENIGNDSTDRTFWESSSWSSFAQPSGTKWAVLRGVIRSQWIGTSATGLKFSLVFKTKTKGNSIEWYGTDCRFEQGSGFL